MNRARLMLLPIVVAAAVMAYQFITADVFTNAETGERHRVAMSTEQEIALGLSAYEEVLSQSRVVQSGPELDLVRRVASRLARATGEQGAAFDWDVSLVESDQANAFALPGGKIVVYTGILPVARTEAGLAAVMGHEMAHATSRHAAQRMFRTQLTQTALMGAQGSMAGMEPEQQRQIMGALGAGAQYGLILPFSRDHENEADQIGLHYMARAGYDPRESINFWKRMTEMSNGQAPAEFASTHPSHETRIQNLEEEMPKALAEYEAAKR
jgi:predicted Zn-dependent protease